MPIGLPVGAAGNSIEDTPRDMFGSLSKKRMFVLTGTEELSALCELGQPGSAGSTVEVLGRTDASPVAEVSLPRLLASGANIKGDLAIVLPLHFFETVSISLPQLPEGVIGKALPYHLSKSISKPIGEYIFDWHVTERLKDRLQLMVYLFSSSIFSSMRTALSGSGIQIKYLEADVFAACAFLEKEQRLSSEHATLIVLLWQNNISMAVYDAERLILIRAIPLAQAPSSSEKITAEKIAAFSVESAGSSSPPEEAPDDDLQMVMMDQEISQPAGDKPGKIIQDLGLAGWDIFTGETDHNKEAADYKRKAGSSLAKAPLESPDTELPSVSRRIDYCRQVGLEILRTRDYFVTVMKGRQIGRIYVGADSSLVQELNLCNREFVGLEMLSLTDGRVSDLGSFPALLQVMAIGAGIR